MLCCSLIIEILTKIGCLESSGFCFSVVCLIWGSRPIFSTPSEGNSSGPIGSFFHQRFVKFTTWPWVNVGPTLFTVVLKDIIKNSKNYEKHPICDFISINKVELQINILLKLRSFKNRELDLSDLPQNSNFGREFVQKSGVQIPVGEGQFFCPFFFSFSY